MLNTTVSNLDILIRPAAHGPVWSTDTGVSPTAVRYDGPVTIPANAVVSARTLWGDSWSTLRTAATDSLPLRIAEVMYHPADPTPAEIAAGFDDADDFEFVELVNISDETIDVSDVRFVESTVGGETEGIVFDFGQGTFNQLGPGDRALVVENRAAFEFRYGTQLPIAGQWSGGLRNSSEQITLMVGERLLQQFTYQDDWHPSTDGSGPSLEIIDPINTEMEGWNDGRAGNRAPSSVAHRESPATPACRAMLMAMESLIPPTSWPSWKRESTKTASPATQRSKRETGTATASSPRMTSSTSCNLDSTKNNRPSPRSPTLPSLPHWPPTRRRSPRLQKTNCSPNGRTHTSRARYCVPKTGLNRPPNTATHGPPMFVAKNHIEHVKVLTRTSRVEQCSTSSGNCLTFYANRRSYC